MGIYSKYGEYLELTVCERAGRRARRDEYISTVIIGFTRECGECYIHIY